MQQLQATGFDVDAISHREFGWDRLEQYNALVLVDFPQVGQVTHESPPAGRSGPNLEQTLTLLDRFRAVGGGMRLGTPA